MKDSDNQKVDLIPVDRVEILVLMDSMADYLLPASENVVRPPLAAQDHIHRIPLLAEHGLSLLIRLIIKESCQTILLDTGWSGSGLSHNIKLLDVDLESVDAIVLSHGHIDHCGGLIEVLDRISHPIPVIVHPDAFLSVRYLDWQERVNLIQLDRQDVIDKGGQLVESAAPFVSPDNFWATTGEVPRVSGFEKGLPNAYLERNGNQENDDILDDQSIVIRLKDRGLLIISGCAHAGIINTVKQCLKITAIDEVYAIIGGFHLAGNIEEKVREETLNAIEEIGPEVIIPMHCTGFDSIAKIRQRLPKNTYLSSVGTKFLLPIP
jgi:7,8-dihydropterin-6-yl-methyl-4-(beta-D-ribofuranosyl)aminobenzene 5'-phosphate synthase